MLRCTILHWAMLYTALRYTLNYIGLLEYGQDAEILVFHQLRLSKENHKRVRINAPDWWSVITRRNSATLLNEGEIDLDSHGMILVLIIHWLRPPLFLLW